MTKESTRNSFGPECAALEVVCMEAYEGGKVELLRELLSQPGFDWAEFIGQSLRQKLSPLVSSVLAEQDLRGLIYPGGLRPFFADALNLNRHKHALLRRELSHISEGLRGHDIPFVVRKGLLLDLQLYGGRSLRVLGDLDFMIEPGHAPRIAEVMRGLGYQNGNYDEQQERFIPYSRQELITFRLSPDHLPKFVRATGDPLCKAIDVDFATSFSWARSEFDVPLAEAFATRVDYVLPHMELPVPGFAPAFQFLDTVLHCYREAYTESAIRAGNDVELRKFLDVLLLWKLHREALETEQFRTLVASSNLGAPLAWVFTYTDRLFGQGLVERFGLAGAVGEEQLACWRASGGEVRRWSGDIRERLYAKNRRGLFLDEYRA